MSSDRRPYRDPLINDIRRRRREVFERCGNDLRKLGEMIQRCQAEHPDKVVDRRKEPTSR